MPIYEYECGACGHRFERIQRFSDAPVDLCPKCGERNVQKLLSSPAIQFKGTGWYVTDYASKGAAPKETTDSKDTKDSTETKDSKEAKPAATESKGASTSSGTTDTAKSSS